MSKSSNYSGRTIVVDKVVQLAEEENSGLDYFAQQLEIEAQKLTAKQSEYNNKYSIAVSGRFVATDRTPAEITLNIYRNDTKLTSSDAVVFGSSIAYVSENGTYAEYGEYASLYTRTIPITKLKNLTESVRCVWRGNDSNAIPLVTTFKIDVGEAVEYAYSKYTDEDKVKSQGELQWWYSVEDAKKVTSDDLRYLWQRRSSNYDFDTQQYTDWKYYKTDIDYPSKSTDDTAKDTIEIITPAKYVTFLSSKNTFTVNRRATDGETDILTFSYVCSGYKTHEIDSAKPWIATAYKSNGEVSQLATGTATTFSFSVKHNEGYSSIVVTATVLTNKGTGLEESHAYTLTLTPIDVTLPEKYLGVLTTLPTGGVLPDGSRAEGGDWFVFKDTNVMYVYDSATLTWTAYDSSDSLDTIPLEKVSVALGDMINLGTNDHTTATLMGVFKALCADRAFVKFLQVWGLYVGADKFKVEIAEYDRDTGEKLANPLFKVSYDDKVVFQINASTGDIFLGTPVADLSAPLTGLMYNASQKLLTTKDGNFQVMENGDVYGYFKKVTQFVPFGFEDSLDSSHPFECEFNIPEGAELVKITLSLKALYYRAYSTSALYRSDFWAETGSIPIDQKNTAISLSVSTTKYNNGLADSMNTSSSGGHAHSYSKPSGLSTPYLTNGTTEQNSYSSSGPAQHTHKYVYPNGITTTSDNTSSGGAHTHSYTIPAGLLTGVTVSGKLSGIDHSHKLDISHGHDLVYGIYEGPYPSDITFSCDKTGDGTYGDSVSLGTIKTVTDLDITSYIKDYDTPSKNVGWKAIKFTSSTLGRLRVQLMLELKVSTSA